MEPEDDKTQTHVGLTKGTMVSHYRIIEKIGAGGMGEVYLAQDTKLNRKVALKFLPPHLCQDEDCRKRFTREAQAAAKLDHPNIVPVYEVGEHQGRPYFVMAHIEGRSLRDVIKAGSLRTNEAVALAMQICEGLQEAHETGIIHRDVKPGNVIIDHKGRPRLLDFGLSMITTEEKLTKSGSTLGTVGYMSPEQIAGKKVDHRSDIFSVGVILYEMLAGRRPFEGDNEAATLNSVLNDIPEPLSRYKSGVSSGLQQIVSKLLEKDPQLRYQSAAGAISDLKRLRSDTAPVRRSKVGLWVASVFIVVAAAITLLLTRPWTNRPATGRPEKIRIAVLPFKNLGTPDDEYFADGVTEEIVSRLGAINDLGVISSTSSFTYKNSEKTLPQIARELAVDYILEGNIRWNKSSNVDSVRVTSQLIQADGDIHLWSKSHDEAMTNVIAVQSEIAGQIARVLDIRLTSSEESQVNNVPTENMEAYAHYLKARDIQSFEARRISEKIAHFSRALELDSSFAAAYAGLSIAISEYNIYVNLTAPTDTARKAKEFAKKAIALGPEQPDGYRALGQYYYWVEWDFDNAERYFTMALQRGPNDADVLWSLGMLARRTGKWNGALTYFQQANKLEPTVLKEEYLQTAVVLRKLDLALELVNNQLLFEPDNYGLMVYKAEIIGLMSNDLNALADAVPADAEDHLQDQPVRYLLLSLRMMQRDYEASKRIARSFLDQPSNKYEVAYTYLRLAEIESHSTDRATSAYADTAIMILDSLRSQDLVQTMTVCITAMLGHAYSLKGDMAIARVFIDSSLAVDLYQYDAPNAYINLWFNCLALIRVGDHDRALDVIDQLLNMPAYFYPLDLKYLPYYDPLRDHPRFKELTEKYGGYNEI